MPRILHGIAAAAHSKPTEAGKISAHNLAGRRARQPQRQRRLAQCTPDPMPGSAPGQLRGARRSDRAAGHGAQPSRILHGSPQRCARDPMPDRARRTVRTGSREAAAADADPAGTVPRILQSCSGDFMLSQNGHTKFSGLPARLTKQVPFTQYPFCQSPAAIVQNRARHYVFAYWVKAAAPQLGRTRTPAQFSQNQHTEPATKKPPSGKARRDPDRARGEQPHPLS